VVVMIIWLLVVLVLQLCGVSVNHPGGDAPSLWLWTPFIGLLQLLARTS
jgi:hypothetical protein